MKISKATLFFILSAVLTTSLGIAAGGRHFKTQLSGKQAVPAVMTKASGEAFFRLSKNGKEITFDLKVKGIENVTAAHIHAGKKDQEGPPVAGLFSGPEKRGMFSGELAKGTITDKDLVGPLAGKSIPDLVAMIKSGEAYVNVHTARYPNGELRGQIH